MCHAKRGGSEKEPILTILSRSLRFGMPLQDICQRKQHTA